MDLLIRILILLIVLLSAGLHLSIKAMLRSRRVRDVHQRTRQQINCLMMELLDEVPEETQQIFLKRNLQILESHVETVKEL